VSSWRIRQLEADAWALVTCAEVQAYLLGLQAKGIGLQRAAKLAGLSPDVVRVIRNGERRRVRRRTADKLLALRPVKAFGVCVPAWPTWRLIRLLLNEGYTRKALAGKLGLSSLRLSAQNERVTLETALKVQALYKLLTAECLEDPPAAGEGLRAS
jgi:hypothetical protein